jgi:hypothetical protein
MDTLNNDFLLRYNELLQARAREYPSRQYQGKTELLAMYDRLVEELLRLSRDCPSLGDRLPFDLQNPVFICGFPKSGTTMLTALLDNHPDLLVIPGDAEYLKIKRNFQGRPLPDITTRLRRYLMTMTIHPLGLNPFWLLSHQQPAWEPYAQLFRYFDDAVQMAAPTFDGIWEAMLRALRASLGSSAGIWVEKTPANEFDVPYLSSLYPRAKFIHILRHPAANLASLKQMGEVGNDWDIINYQAAYLRRSMRLAGRHQTGLGEGRYLVIRYEDLTAEPRAYMQTVADFLGIPFDESLTQATVMGLPSTPNSSYKERLRQDGEVLRSHDKWREVLTDWEQAFIGFQLRGVAVPYGYDLPVAATPLDYWRAYRTSHQQGKPIKFYRALRYFLESYW